MKRVVYRRSTHSPDIAFVSDKYLRWRVGSSTSFGEPADMFTMAYEEAGDLDSLTENQRALIYALYIGDAMVVGYLAPNGTLIPITGED